MAQGLMVITPSQFRCQVRGLRLQPGRVLTMHIFHHRDISLSLGTGMLPTKDATTNPIMQQHLATGAEVTPILPMVSKATLIPGRGNLDMLLLHWGLRTLLGCIQPAVPRKPISRILSQPPVHRRSSQGLDPLHLWALHLFPHHSARKMNLST